LRKKIKRRTKSKKYPFLYFALLILFLIFIFVSIIRSLERYVMPTVLAMAEIRAKTIASHAIGKAVKKSIQKQGLHSQDLVIYDYNDNQEIISYSINTIKIYELSAEVIEELAHELDTIGETVVSIPIGNVMKSQIFSNVGPSIKIEVIPIGTVHIDYGTSFISTGINQVNHRIWLEIDTELQIVSPLKENKIMVSQQFTLVDRVMRGTVPPHYINIPSRSEVDDKYLDFNTFDFRY